MRELYSGVQKLEGFLRRDVVMYSVTGTDVGGEPEKTLGIPAT